MILQRVLADGKQSGYIKLMQLGADDIPPLGSDPDLTRAYLNNLEELYQNTGLQAFVRESVDDHFKSAFTSPDQRAEFVSKFFDYVKANPLDESSTGSPSEHFRNYIASSLLEFDLKVLAVGASGNSAVSDAVIQRINRLIPLSGQDTFSFDIVDSEGETVKVTITP